MRSVHLVSIPQKSGPHVQLISLVVKALSVTDETIQTNDILLT